MGVAGAGKTVIGSRLASALGTEYVEGDDYHPPANVAKMAAGIPLDDADRAGWLDALAAKIADARRGGRGLVLAASVLKRSYRERLRAADPDLRFVLLTAPKPVIADRLEQRRGHYMPPSLLDSQLAILETPGDDERAWIIDNDRSPEAIVAGIVENIEGEQGASSAQRPRSAELPRRTEGGA
jgi:gluconokinase